MGGSPRRDAGQRRPGRAGAASARRRRQPQPRRGGRADLARAPRAGAAGDVHRVPEEGREYLGRLTEEHLSPPALRAAAWLREHLEDPPPTCRARTPSCRPDHRAGDARRASPPRRRRWSSTTCCSSSAASRPDRRRRRSATTTSAAPSSAANGRRWSSAIARTARSGSSRAKGSVNPPLSGSDSGVAQSAEHAAVNRGVVGSSPTPGASRSASAAFFDARQLLDQFGAALGAVVRPPQAASSSRFAANDGSSQQPPRRPAQRRRPAEAPRQREAGAGPGDPHRGLAHVADDRADQHRGAGAEGAGDGAVAAVGDHQARRRASAGCS